jgi:hypothetical protein
MDMAVMYSSIVTNAVASQYSRVDLFTDNQKLRLATEVVNRGKKFAQTLLLYGHAYSFEIEKSALVRTNSPMDKSAVDSYVFSDKPVRTRQEDNHPDTAHITCEDATIPAPNYDGIIEWLRKLYNDHRGFEIGTFATSLLAAALKHQASRWKALALGYIGDVITLVHSFIFSVLDHLAPSHRVSTGIKSLLLESLTEKYASAIERTKSLIRVELEGTPATYNHYFNDILEKRYVDSKCLLCIFIH